VASLLVRASYYFKTLDIVTRISARETPPAEAKKCVVCVLNEKLQILARVAA